VIHDHSSVLIVDDQIVNTTARSLLTQRTRTCSCQSLHWAEIEPHAGKNWSWW